MKGMRVVLVVAALAAALAVGAPALAQEDTVDICHFPPGNPENVQVMTVGENAAARHVSRHDDFLVFGFNVNGVGCAFCAEDSPDCQLFCVGTPPCLCPPDDLDACCEANPCCDPCPEPKPPECDLIFCGSDPPDCSITVCSGEED